MNSHCQRFFAALTGLVLAVTAALGIPFQTSSAAAAPLHLSAPPIYLAGIDQESLDRKIDTTAEKAQRRTEIEYGDPSESTTTKAQRAIRGAQQDVKEQAEAAKQKAEEAGESVESGAKSLGDRIKNLFD
jgi:hypothetical protein